jgi:hypothetical protein
LRFRMLIRNSMLSLRTDCPTADNRDRHEHDGNPALSAQPVLFAGKHVFHVPLSFLLDFGNHRLGQIAKGSNG